MGLNDYRENRYKDLYLFTMLIIQSFWVGPLDLRLLLKLQLQRDFLLLPHPRAIRQEISNGEERPSGLLLWRNGR